MVPSRVSSPVCSMVQASFNVCKCLTRCMEDMAEIDHNGWRGLRRVSDCCSHWISISFAHLLYITYPWALFIYGKDQITPRLPSDRRLDTFKTLHAP